MTITFIRHAEVIDTYKGKYNGHIDIPLSENGLKEAKKLSKKLNKKKFDIVYCSDLLRAKETLQVFNLTAKTVLSDQLREKSWGRHEGKSFMEIEKEGIKYVDFKQWISALDGESVEEFTNRVDNYLKNVILECDKKNILVVTHSGVIKTVISLVKNISLEEAFSHNIEYLSSVKVDTKAFNIIFE